MKNKVFLMLGVMLCLIVLGGCIPFPWGPGPDGGGGGGHGGPGGGGGGPGFGHLRG